jgi:hypothetical protein
MQKDLQRRIKNKQLVLFMQEKLENNHVVELSGDQVSLTTCT